MNTQTKNILFAVGGFALAFIVMGVIYNGDRYHEYNRGMKDHMGSMTSGLVGKTGDDFDKAFIAEMIIHHQGAVAMANQVLATSKRPELIMLANDIISAQTKEITMMEEWQKTWFK